MSLLLPNSVDSAWPSGQETTASIPLLDPFLVKAIALICVAIAIFGLIRNLNKHRKGRSYLKGMGAQEFLTDEIVFDRSISPTRIVYYCLTVLLIAIPLFLIVHLGLAILLVLFLLLIIGSWIYFDAFVQHSKVVINRKDKTIRLSSTIGERSIKSEEIKVFNELVFKDYNDDGYRKHALFIDKVDSSWPLWNDFSSDEVILIQDWLRATSLENSGIARSN